MAVELLKENISENKNNENPEEEIRVIVQLKAAPAVKVEKDEYTSSVKKKEEKLIKSQSSIVGEVEKITGTKVKRNFGYLVNGFSINTKRKNFRQKRKSWQSKKECLLMNMQMIMNGNYPDIKEI